MPSVDIVSSASSLPTGSSGMEAYHKTTLTSGGTFPTDADYLEKSLSVWLGECQETNFQQSSPTIDVAPLDIWTAASIGNFEFVKRIVENEAPADSSSSTALPSSSSSFSSSSSLSSTNNLNARNKGGWTALMYASYIGHDNIVHLLLSQESIDVNVKSSPSGHRELTALMLASSCGNEAISALLLDHGADVNARDKKGCVRGSVRGVHEDVKGLFLT